MDIAGYRKYNNTSYMSLLKMLKYCAFENLVKSSDLTNLHNGELVYDIV